MLGCPPHHAKLMSLQLERIELNCVKNCVSVANLSSYVFCFSELKPWVTASASLRTVTQNILLNEMKSILEKNTVTNLEAQWFLFSFYSMNFQ